MKKTLTKFANFEEALLSKVLLLGLNLEISSMAQKQLKTMEMTQKHPKIYFCAHNLNY